MIVTDKVRRSKRVEMTEEQAKNLASALAKVEQYSVSNEGVTLTRDESDVMNDLRESLLNS